MTPLFGPLREGPQVRFRLFSPQGTDIFLELEGRPPIAMERADENFLEAAVEAQAGTRYRYRKGDVRFPDPASRQQIGGVHGWSAVTEPSAYRWRQDAWKGRPWEETILYEIHPGLAGGFEGVAKRLSGLRDLGFTAIELMPIAAFPGARNWGYDGVLPFAPAEAYGTPDALKSLIDRAHELGLMVFLDVVYNHFGPEGNYLALYAPEFFRKDVHTPWGDALDFRNTMVRRFFTENALYWLSEFRFDGLRFDAVHAFHPPDWLSDLAKQIRETVQREVHLVVENDDNDAKLLEVLDAQWNDDFHHVLHVLLTGECRGYYADHADDRGRRLARVLSEGFDYQGEYSGHRKTVRGSPSGTLPPSSFVAFLQNHDQIGNRARGERLTALAHPEALKAAIALLMLAPSIPLVFAGEEIGSKAPFLYFTDHPPQLA
ncbi:MAG: malto-oligosyltrehalose trehalohydrolase, partial [Alphaproteobacteria bacterium]|nr:malto-oligosyltrehalose trehalohydrolase [Alphaproteobacteria bacterium]